MIRPLNGKLLVKPYQVPTNIYMTTASSNIYEVVSISLDESFFNVGEKVVLDINKIIIVDNVKKLYIVLCDDVLAKVEDE